VKKNISKTNNSPRTSAEPRPGTSGKGEGRAAADIFLNIPRKELFPDPDQPRKTFDEAGLKELAESITQQGIVQPLIVRRVPAKYKISEPDLTSDDYHVHELVDGVWQLAFQNKQESACVSFAGAQNLADRHVIVAGERRWRASEIAGLESLPCIVRDIEGHKVFAQQFIENEQRVNISALEEAEALQKQMEVRRMAAGGFSVEDLAKELGMSRAGLYQRLALTRLHAPVREALLAGKISTSAASVVAIVPLPKDQEKLLKEITDENSWKFPYSVRDVQEIVNDDYCQQLTEAPFKLDSDQVFEGGGPDQFKNQAAPVYVGACKTCPHRSGNLADQFPELAKRPNVCTRPDCFAAKCKAHWVATAQDLAQRGKTVLVEKEFKKVSKDYIDADREGWGLFANDYAAPAKVLGKHAPEPVLVSTATGLKKYFKRTDIPGAAKAAKVKLSSEATDKTETAEARVKREAKEKLERETGERREAFVKAQFPTLLKALAKLKAAEAWALGVELVKQHDGYADDDLAEAADEAKDDQARVLGFLFADNDNDPLNYNNNWDEHGVKLWKLAGIDLKAGFAASELAAQKALPLADKKTPEQGKLLEVKPNSARAKIITAQKARWAKLKANK